MTKEEVTQEILDASFRMKRLIQHINELPEVERDARWASIGRTHFQQGFDALLNSLTGERHNLE